MKNDSVNSGYGMKLDISYYCSDVFKSVFGSNFDEWETKVGEIEESLSETYTLVGWTTNFYRNIFRDDTGSYRFHLDINETIPSNSLAELVFDVNFSNGSCVIDSIEVRESARGKKCGSRIVSGLESVLRNSGFKEVRLIPLDDGEENIGGASLFWKKLAYSPDPSPGSMYMSKFL